MGPVGALMKVFMEKRAGLNNIRIVWSVSQHNCWLAKIDYLALQSDICSLLYSHEKTTGKEEEKLEGLGCPHLGYVLRDCSV